MQKNELENLIIAYGDHKSEMDSIKKLADDENKKIKSIMKNEDLTEFETSRYTAKYSVQERESIDEEGLLEYLKENVDNVEGLIKTKEYIDSDILENAIYNKKIPDNIISGMSKFNSTKSVEVLKIVKAKK